MVNRFKLTGFKLLYLNKIQNFASQTHLSKLSFLVYCLVEIRIFMRLTSSLCALEDNYAKPVGLCGALELYVLTG